MDDYARDEELNERLTLIEQMIANGRRSTGSWGWTFILWGIAYYAAIAWSEWSHNAWTWPAVVLLAVIVTAVVASSKAGNHPGTTLGRAIGSIWAALGISMFVLFIGLGLSGRLTDQHVFTAVLSAMLGVGNGASALILRWKIQFACAVVWWATALATCYANDRQSMIVFLVAIFLCQIAFGTYSMIVEPREHRRSGPIDV